MPSNHIHGELLSSALAALRLKASEDAKRIERLKIENDRLANPRLYIRIEEPHRIDFVERRGRAS